MDITTLGGLIAGWGLVALAIVLGGVGFGPYIDIPSVIIVFGGTIAVVAGQYESKDLARVGKAMGVAFNKVQVEPIDELIEKITFYATEIKKHGVMHIEQKVLEETNPFFKEAFQLLVDGTKAETLVPLLETKLEHIEKRHSTMISLFGSAGGVAGSMGMIGTLVGLVAMLANLSDPSAVGPAMAVALLTTMYGALTGTLIAGLVENKLSEKNKVEMNAGEIIIMGTSMIAEEAAIGDIKMKLNAILAEAPE
ncbi:MAG: MotA/TolQ/ExbB proton channel family protein [Sphaerochaetaceae bacterium]|nr:MotA/TolQ/ExbB proton channel family protein [Sphaerochaetaceae bacterium]